MGYSLTRSIAIARGLAWTVPGRLGAARLGSSQNSVREWGSCVLGGAGLRQGNFRPRLLWPTGAWSLEHCLAALHGCTVLLQTSTTAAKVFPFWRPGRAEPSSPIRHRNILHLSRCQVASASQPLHLDPRSADDSCTSSYPSVASEAAASVRTLNQTITSEAAVFVYFYRRTS